MSRTNNPKLTKKDKKKKVEKPVSNDPRPRQSEIGKKYKNYPEYNRAVIAWNKRRKAKLEAEKNKDSRLTKRGRKPKTKNNLKVKPKGPFAKDRVGEVDLNSKEYKKAKTISYCVINVILSSGLIAVNISNFACIRLNRTNKVFFPE